MRGGMVATEASTPGVSHGGVAQDAAIASGSSHASARTWHGELLETFV